MSEIDSQNKRLSASGDLPVPGGSDTTAEREHLAGLYRLSEVSCATVIGGLALTVALFSMGLSAGATVELGTSAIQVSPSGMTGGMSLDIPLGTNRMEVEVYGIGPVTREELDAQMIRVAVYPPRIILGEDLDTIRVGTAIHAPQLSISSYLDLEESRAEIIPFPMITPSLGRATISYRAECQKQVIWSFRGKQPGMTFIGAARIWTESLVFRDMAVRAKPWALEVHVPEGVIGPIRMVVTVNPLEIDTIHLGCIAITATAHEIGTSEEIGGLALAIVNGGIDAGDLHHISIMVTIKGLAPIVGTAAIEVRQYPITLVEIIGGLSIEMRPQPISVGVDVTLGTATIAITQYAANVGASVMLGARNIAVRTYGIGMGITETLGAAGVKVTPHAVSIGTGMVVSPGSIAVAVAMHATSLTISSTANMSRLPVQVIARHPELVIGCELSTGTASIAVAARAMTVGTGDTVNLGTMKVKGTPNAVSLNIGTAASVARIQMTITPKAVTIT